MKLERLFGILLILLTEKRVSANYLANYFEVSKRTIYRDIESIELAGIPIITYSGRDGGIELVNNCKIDSHLFGEKEKELIIDSLKLRKTLFEDRSTDLLIKKIEKISDEDIYKQLSKSIDILKFSIIRDEMEIDTKNKLKLLKEAIDEKRIVRFRYTNYYGETILRQVEPLLIRLNNGFWYFNGFCKFRNDFRVFKLTRIRALEITEKTFIPKHENDNNLTYIADYKNCDVVILKFHRAELGKLYDYFTEAEFIEINTESVTVKFKYYHDYNLINFILGFGSSVKIIEPEYLKEKFLGEVEKILKKIKN
ncbi:helix-turn-helix transcriptional regulator [Clostridium ganghwense]|uniref:YafY family protein n=1 Tax=Clostridium ganghwense TaxID=312089 RepID=A0ABT4CRN0_9CLOT|nr:YafY family protein [Clostridium ganghwense]MCY6371694.1 YafY family protein [Clostridium ganghwense]